MSMTDKFRCGQKDVAGPAESFIQWRNPSFWLNFIQVLGLGVAPLLHKRMIPQPLIARRPT